jgi:hypothetical protein
MPHQVGLENAFFPGSAEPGFFAFDFYSGFMYLSGRC